MTELAYNHDDVEEGFAQVAQNDPTVAAILQSCACDAPELAAAIILKRLVLALAEEKVGLHKRLVLQSHLMPKRYRMADGSISTYYPPEECVPIVEIQPGIADKPWGLVTGGGRKRG